MMKVVLLLVVAVPLWLPPSGCSVPFAPVVKVSVGEEVAEQGTCECICKHTSEQPTIKTEDDK